MGYVSLYNWSTSVLIVYIFCWLTHCYHPGVLGDLGTSQSLVAGEELNSKKHIEIRFILLIAVVL